MEPARPELHMGSGTGRWVIAATVLGSAVAFIDGTVVNAALPAITEDLGADLAGAQWVVTGYLLSLSALLVIGGSLGDLRGRRRVFVIGLTAFAVTSALCGLAPSIEVLILGRVLQGAAAALLLPASLAIISATFAPSDRGAAIGAWSGLGGIAGAIGPFLGGWLIQTISWRAVFFINLPLCAVTIVLAWRHVPETLDDDADPRLDVTGGVLLAAGLAGVVYGLIEGPAAGWTAPTVVAVVVGALLLVSWVVDQARARHPMVPLVLFASRQFSGANGTTLFVYAALGSVMFLTVVHLQTDLGYSPIAAGASFLPLTLIMLLFSARAGALSQRIGPKVPMTVGPLLAAVGILLLVRVEPGASYIGAVLPAVLVLGAGLCFTVAPLTAAVLAAVDDHHAGVGSAINNAVARLGSLLAVAVLPAAAGLSGPDGSLDLSSGFGRAMVITAAISAIGGLIALATVQRAEPVVAIVHGNLGEPCFDPCVRVDEAEAGAA